MNKLFLKWALIILNASCFSLHLLGQLKELYFLYKMSIKKLKKKKKTNTWLHTFLASTHKKGKRHLPSPWHSFHSFSYS